MKARFLLPVVVLLLCLTTLASGQRTLQSDEILQIFTKLTSEPRTAWIPAGTIGATHREQREPKITDSTVLADEIDKRVKEYKDKPNKIELTDELQKMKLAAIPFNVRYKLANRHTMDSTVVVKYDGERFYWETYVDSRQDSVVPDSSLAGNFMTEQFDLPFNRKTICAWDGEEYVTYTVSGRFATVDAAGHLPRAVNGPLTAGLIPWGHGRFTYDNLLAADASATELTLNSQNQIQMSLDWADGASVSLTLDPAMDYAVTACTLPAGDDQVSVNDYGDYRLVGGYWVPGTIFMERRDATTGKVLGSDRWTLTTIDGAVPPPGSFTVEYESDTFIQYMSSLTPEPTTFIYSSSMDMRRLLADRLAYIAAEGRKPQNCATAAVDYVASRLGKTVPDNTLATLVQSGGQTTLASMKQLIEGLGLYCRAVQADLTSLQNLGPAKTILHLPAENHFVVLDSIDNGRVQIVDLSDSKFCYSDSVDSFKQRWSQGPVLLVSSTPIAGPYASVNDAGLTTILGGSGWACTRILQYEHWYFCDPPCCGYYTYYWTRYGCQAAESGTCSSQVLVRYQETACVFNSDWICTSDGYWYYYYMFACK
jgi:hypothetical protein